ncbi:MAG: N-acetyltransferase [candidate division KSB1 bacterium]|nr:N-acetyltransferase [candidate division KSB1 bacterium]
MKSNKRKNDYFIHPSAIVETDTIGANTRVWAFAHVMKGAQIGNNCNIGDHCFIESDVRIGNEVTIKNGVSIWNCVTIEDFAFIGPNVVFTNDMFPRSKVYKDTYLPTLIRKGASIGANATLLCGIEIGEYALIGAGSVVTRDVPAFSLVYGNPAVWKGYVCKCGNKIQVDCNKKLATCSCGLQYVSTDGGLVLSIT